MYYSFPTTVNNMETQVMSPKASSIQEIQNYELTLSHPFNLASIIFFQRFFKYHDPPIRHPTSTSPLRILRFPISHPSILISHPSIIISYPIHLTHPFTCALLYEFPRDEIIRSIPPNPLLSSIITQFISYLSHPSSFILQDINAIYHVDQSRRPGP